MIKYENSDEVYIFSAKERIFCRAIVIGSITLGPGDTNTVLMHVSNFTHAREHLQLLQCGEYLHPWSVPEYLIGSLKVQ